MDAATRTEVRRRALERCEHCLLPEAWSPLTHHIEHIIAKQHGGSDDLENLALACHRCNLHKGPNLTGLDPESRQIVPLFHPRRDSWQEHFEVVGLQIQGRTPTGRATVHVLAMNDPQRLQLRREMLGERGSYL